MNPQTLSNASLDASALLAAFATALTVDLRPVLIVYDVPSARVTTQSDALPVVTILRLKPGFCAFTASVLRSFNQYLVPVCFRIVLSLRIAPYGAF